MQPKTLRRVIVAWAGYFFAGIVLSLATAWAGSLYGILSYSTHASKHLGARSNGRWWVLQLSEYPWGVFYGNAFLMSDEIAKVDGIRGPLQKSVPIWSCTAVPPAPGDPDWVDVVESACGWPITAWYGSFRTSGGELWEKIGAPRNSAKAPGSIRRPRGKAGWCMAFASLKGDQGLVILPYRPVLPGAPFSILLYSVFAWMIHAAIRAATRVPRRRDREPGGCRVCGYDLAGLGTCPECGAAVGGQREEG